MNTGVHRWVVAGAVLLGVVIGCSTVIDQVADEAGTGADVGDADSGFSDAPVSPGGTGGTTDPVAGGATEGVELPSEDTRSFFTAFQIDPVEEDTAGPKFVVSGDVNQDGLLDLVSGWNQSQPIQLHLQERDADDNISFRTVTIAGTSPVAVVAGVELGQINDDGWLDIVVLVKATGSAGMCPATRCVTSGDCNGTSLCIDGCCDGACNDQQVSRLDGDIVIYFSPGGAANIPDGDLWSQTILINPLVVDSLGNQWSNQFPGAETLPLEEAKTKPEFSGFVSLIVADIDGANGDDIVVAVNPAACEELGQAPPVNTVDLWVNPGGAASMTSGGWGVPNAIHSDLPQVKDIKAMDIDSDGDLDIIATYTNAISRNVRWARNPRPAAPVTGSWENRPIGQVDTEADILAIGDVDNDGFDDILVRSTLGSVVQWFRRPNAQAIEPEFPPSDTLPARFNFPWPVFTLTEFGGQEPGAIALGDVTGDGQVEALVAVEGGVLWYDALVGDTVFDPWTGNTVIQDEPDDSGGTANEAPGGSGVGVSGTDSTTVINDLLIVDLDGDGRNDIIGTLDRRAGSGLSDDRLVWYRNTRTDN